jgi:decaprenylphospho-beta-D-ribofuranose 2-oxidase
MASSWIVPAGFFLPVTPGTRNVSVGGAIAADVHGKNHHVDGSFGNHVLRLRLVDGSGQVRDLQHGGPSSAEEQAMFWATIGGMGLTGVILEATFSLIPISSSLISVDTTRFQDLEALMGAMVEADTPSSQGFQAVGGDVSAHLLAIGGAPGARPAGSPGGARF